MFPDEHRYDDEYKDYDKAECLPISSPEEQIKRMEDAFKSLSQALQNQLLPLAGVFSNILREDTKPMSERQEKKKRYNQKLVFIARFEKWISEEPPIWRFFKWHRWKKCRPIWEENNG